MTVLAAVFGLFLAYANGANDNFKGVATLFGSATADYRRALLWATVTTFAGSLAAVTLAGSLVIAFTGKGLVPDALVGAPAFTLGVAAAAGITVMLATRFGLPISTTHVSCGALFGIGAVTGHAKWKTIATIVAAWVTTLPLAAGLGWAAYMILEGWV